MLRLIVKTEHVPIGEDADPAPPMYHTFDVDCSDMERLMAGTVPAGHARTIVGVEVREAPPAPKKVEAKPVEKKGNYYHAGNDPRKSNGNGNGPQETDSMKLERINKMRQKHGLKPYASLQEMNDRNAAPKPPKRVGLLRRVLHL